MNFVVGGLVNGGRGGEHVIDMPVEERKVEVRYTCSFTWVCLHVQVYSREHSTLTCTTYTENLDIGSQMITEGVLDYSSNYHSINYFSQELSRAPLIYYKFIL